MSIVVPAFNEEKLITASLRQMRAAAEAFDELGWETELIVCDNNSTDRTAELARADGARVVFEPVNQIARARNRGAEAASGDWLIFIDADSHPSRELFLEVADLIRRGDCLGGGATVRLDERLGWAEVVTGVWNWISRITRSAAGSFVFCEALAFREAGGFSLDLFASEEIELSRRLKKLARQRGLRFVIIHRQSILTSARKVHLYSRWVYLRFFLSAMIRPRRTLRSRELCQTWYDGRR